MSENFNDITDNTMNGENGNKTGQSKSIGASVLSMNDYCEKQTLALPDYKHQASGNKGHQRQRKGAGSHPFPQRR